MALGIMVKEPQVRSKTNWNIISDPNQNILSGSKLNTPQ
jgi:hypothetical protein